MSNQHEEYPELTQQAQAAYRAGCFAASFSTPLTKPDRRYLAAFLREVIKGAGIWRINDEFPRVIVVEDLEAIANNLHALPPGYIDAEHQGGDRELLEAFQRAWWAESGSSDKCHMAGIRAVLALRPTVAAGRAADAAISNEDLEAEFRAWWKAQGWDEDLAALHVVLIHVAWGRHLLSRGEL